MDAETNLLNLNCQDEQSSPIRQKKWWKWHLLSSSKEEYDRDNIDGEDKESEEGKEQEGINRYDLQNCIEVWWFPYEKKRDTTTTFSPV